MKPLLFLRGRCLFSGPLSPSRPDPCLASICLSSFFLVWFVRRRRVFSFSFSLSLSGAGEPQTFLVWGSPCVSSTWTRSPPSIRTSSSSPTPRHCPAPVFFFFFSSSSLVPGSVFARPGSVGVGFLGGCFFFSVSGLCFPLCVALQDRPRHF